MRPTRMECPVCGHTVYEVRAHLECRQCGVLESCCEGAPGEAQMICEAPRAPERAGTP